MLAFDYGERRTGVAVGDARLRTAHPLPAIAAAGAARMAAIAKLVHEWRPERLVLGLPLGSDGGKHRLGQKVARFARELEAHFCLPVAQVDERYTSSEAESRMREAVGARRAAQASRERKLDSYAAQLILQQYFDESSA
ncbi:MAG TPA: Holliday junction resolvase RuvX [Burkholderiales bacterium]|nr:Holliday junction resolvase RuvX [Burkholderiales bacterium]